MITSSSNAQMKKIQKLKKSARFRRQERCFIAEGFKMAGEALDRGCVEMLYISESAREEYEEKLAIKAEDRMVEWVSPAVFREISDTSTPQGVLALVTMPVYDRESLTNGVNAALVCLEDIQDPGNLGTIFRTAEGAGMSGVVLSRGCVDLFNPKVVRATMGALFRVPFYVADHMTEEIKNLRESGFVMYAAALDGVLPYTSGSYTGKVGIIVGNEANGIRPETSLLADEKVIIPMEGELESLNAAVAAALLMYEVHRKRR